MTRRFFQFAVLCSGALLLGGVAGLPRAHGKAAAEEQPSPSQAPITQMPKPAPACKATKDCPADHLCVKVGAQKQCQPTPVKRPVPPVVT